MNFSILIPARFNSSRFKGKPLKKINGKEMIIRVAEQCAKAVKKSKIFIVTDSKKIQKKAAENNFNSIMSPKNIKTGTDRVELYTESFAVGFENGDLKVINDFIKCSKIANSLEMKVNAGHDLNLKNIEYFSTNMPYLHEVSIGHALISESIYLGIDNVINLYIDKLNR